MWALNIVVVALIGLNVWTVQTLMAHDKSIDVLSSTFHGRLDVLSTGVQARLESLASEQARMAKAQEDTAKELREMNSTLVGHISRSDITGETYGNQAKSKAGIH